MRTLDKIAVIEILLAIDYHSKRESEAKLISFLELDGMDNDGLEKLLFGLAHMRYKIVEE